MSDSCSVEMMEITEYNLDKNIPLEGECAEMREGTELSVEARVPLTQFDAVSDIPILVIPDEGPERCGGIVSCLHFHGNERECVADEEVHTLCWCDFLLACRKMCGKISLPDG